MADERERRFLRGELGVDGRPVEEGAEDEESVDRDRARAALHRDRAWLGREMLTWTLWRSTAGAPLIEVEGQPVGVLFVGPVVLQGLGGEATEVATKGARSAYSDVVRAALARGLLVQRARLRFSLDEQVFEVTVDAEQLALRSVRLPTLLTEEEDDQLEERLFLVDRVAAMVDALWERFVERRRARNWTSEDVPALLAWIADGA